MKVEAVEALVVNNEEINKIKTTFQGINIIMNLYTKHYGTITLDMSKGYWGKRIPRVENETLILPTPKDRSPHEERTETTLTTTYHQQEFCIDCNEIISINYDYDRVVTEELSGGDEPENE